MRCLAVNAVLRKPASDAAQFFACVTVIPQYSVCELALGCHDVTRCNDGLKAQKVADCLGVKFRGSGR